MVSFEQMHHHNTYFSKNLISWYLHNKRELPWRNTKDPYKIWLSEIILQQTRVAQGMPYYLKFIKTFPTVQALANAPENEVLKLWQGLGYYSRARNLHFSAKMVANEMGGKFPNTHKDLLKLKGVGDYTASAIASICYNIPEAVVDGNVYRVLSRISGVSIPINSTEGQRYFRNLAQQLIDTADPAAYNQAIIEFGALYCVPQNPDCANCIFRNSCQAFQKGIVSELPVKLKAKPVKKRYFNYIVVISNDTHLLLRQRKSKDIWHKLFEFPLIETSAESSLDELKETSEYQVMNINLNPISLSLYNERSLIHKLSHQHIYTRFWIMETAIKKEEFIPVEQLKDYAVPVLIENFASEFLSDYSTDP